MNINERNINTVVFSKKSEDRIYFITNIDCNAISYFSENKHCLRFIDKSRLDKIIKAINLDGFKRQVDHVKNIGINVEKRIEELIIEQQKVLEHNNKFMFNYIDFYLSLEFLADFPEYTEISNVSLVGNKCPTCGHIKEIECRSCSKKNDDGVEICWNCGGML